MSDVYNPQCPSYQNEVYSDNITSTVAPPIKDSRMQDYLDLAEEKLANDMTKTESWNQHKIRKSRDEWGEVYSEVSEYEWGEVYSDTSESLTDKEILEFVRDNLSLDRGSDGNLRLTQVDSDVFGHVDGHVYGHVGGDVDGHVGGDVGGDVGGHVRGDVRGHV